MNMIPRDRKRNGFTLIELMITVAIVAILATIAYPSYVQQIRKTRREDAKGALTELANFMERNYTVSHRYDQDSAGNPIALPFNQSPRPPSSAFYLLSLQGGAALSQTAYTLQATPTGPQASDSCGTLTLSSTGAKTQNLSTPATAACW